MRIAPLSSWRGRGWFGLFYPGLLSSALLVLLLPVMPLLAQDGAKPGAPNPPATQQHPPGGAPKTLPAMPQFNLPLPKASVKDWGFVRSRTIGTAPAPGTAIGRTTVVTDVSFETRADTLDACMGTRFGVLFQIDEPALFGMDSLTMRVEHPPHHLPDGRIVSVEDYQASPALDMTVYGGFTFDHAYELTTGTWRFTLIYGKEPLATKSFEVKAGACVVS
jgi:hypothetical protein